jgi:hypothetical protein
MANQKNSATFPFRRLQSLLEPPSPTHVSIGSTDQIFAFLIATTPHSKFVVTIIRNNDITFSNRNINPAVADRKTGAKSLVAGAIFASDFVRTARHSSRTAGF